MADEVNAPDVIPGMVAVEHTGPDIPGEAKGMIKNVFPIDARELIDGGNYKLYENGAAEASRLNAGSLRAKPAKAAAKVEEAAPAEAPAPATTPAPASLTAPAVKK